MLLFDMRSHLVGPICAFKCHSPCCVFWHLNCCLSQIHMGSLSVLLGRTPWVTPFLGQLGAEYCVVSQKSLRSQRAYRPQMHSQSPAKLVWSSWQTRYLPPTCIPVHVHTHVFYCACAVKSHTWMLNFAKVWESKQFCCTYRQRYSKRFPEFPR